MEDKEAKSILEAAMFIAGEPMSIDSLKKLLELDKVNTERLLRELVTEYSIRNAGLLIVEVAEGFQMVTSPACAPWVKKLLSTSVPKKLTPSSLETIAIIAYKQPIIKAEIEAIRGVNSDGVVKTLLERRLVKILGRKEAPGRPLMYGTTPEFLQYFGLKDLSELPTLKEFTEMDVPEAPETLPEDQDMQEAVEAFEETHGTSEHKENPVDDPAGTEQKEIAEEPSAEGQEQEADRI
jgi:segregation and condensation protein B